MPRLSYIKTCLLILLLPSCSKSDLLNKKPSTSLVVPSTIEDFRKLMDFDESMNVSGVLGEISADNFLINTYANWQSIASIEQKNAYIWAKDLYQGTGSNDWNYAYKQVLTANIVLDGLAKLDPAKTGQAEYDRTKGWALFMRGHAFYNLAQVFAPAYDESSASTDMGIPLRLEPDVTLTSVRASVKTTYEQVLNDLTQAEALLPDVAPGTDRNRPYKSAANALLARVYLSMRNYALALQYANTSLGLYNQLIDYNTLSTTSATPITISNAETLYQCQPASGGSAVFGTYRVAPTIIADQALYNSYQTNDLRKAILFSLSTTAATLGKPQFKASYRGNTRAFTGIATDEVYLIKAECQTRASNYQDGLNTLNSLLKTRWKNSPSTPYVNYTAGNAADALAIILVERRKELPFRGLRWTDLRRLNKEGANITLKRTLNGIEYMLPPNSPLYVMPIPPDEIRLSGIEQNIR